MPSAAFLFKITLASLVIVSISASFPRCISCPCGSGSQNYTHCIDESVLKNITCEKWSYCQTCKANTTFCITCPPDRFGPTCSKISDGHTRRKRQYNPDRLNYPRYPRQSGSCSFPERPKNGSMTCSQTGNEMTCTSNCLPGYFFEGEENVNEMTLRCRNGIWTPGRLVPPCKSGGDCELSMADAGRFNCTIDMDGTRCDITCKDWYRGRFDCYPGRPWNPPLPFCTVPKEKTSCPCQNGGRCDVNGKCVCPEERTGIYCEDLERQKATCPDPGIPRDGSRLNPDRSDASYRRVFEEEESVIFSCNGESFALQGKSLITCLADGTWSDPLPQCRSTTVYCPDPGYIQFGSRVNAVGSNIRWSSRYRNGQSVVYYCHEEYELVGNSLLTCLPTGQWSSSKPFCRRIDFIVTKPTDPPSETPCRQPVVDINGIIEDHPLLDPRRRGQTFPPDTELKFDCKEGFKPEGEVILFCMPSGEWSSEPPTCKRIVTITTERPMSQGSCSSPGVDVNGIIEGYSLRDPKRGSFPAGTRLKFSCNAGFVQEGATSIVCRRNGQWTSPAPTCRKTVTTTVPPAEVTQLCPLPVVNPNAEVEEFFSLDLRKLQDFEPGEKLTFNCKKGYKLIGQSVIECRWNGRWSSSPPTCNPESRTPTATIKLCPLPEVNANVEVDEFFAPYPQKSQGYEPGDKLNFNCKEDHDLDGPSVIECLGNGRWSRLPPTCNPISPVPPAEVTQSCPLPEVNPNAEVEEFFTMDRRKLQGFEPGDKLTFNCKKGYKLNGQSVIECRWNGRWSSPPPTCNPESRTPLVGDPQLCPAPEVDPNGEVEELMDRRKLTRGFEPGTVLTVRCKEGYILEGSGRIRCSRNGRWSTPTPKCNAKPLSDSGSPSQTRCFNPGSISNGRFDVFPPNYDPSQPPAGDEDSDFPLGTLLTYTCEDGFSLLGMNDTLSCGFGGYWSGSNPMCVKDR